MIGIQITTGCDYKSKFGNIVMCTSYAYSISSYVATNLKEELLHETCIRIHNTDSQTFTKQDAITKLIKS